MSEVAVRSEPMTNETLRYVPPATSTGVDLVRWVAQLQAASEISRQLCNTEFVPPHFRGKVEAATAAVLYGATLGMDPLAAWQAIYVISGRVGMYAKSMVAVLQAAGHDVWTEAQSDKSVTVCARRRDWPEDRVNRCTWDPARAMAAGLYTNSKYKTNPAQMFYARAASEVCRQTAADALHGMAYSVEEIEDMAPLTTVSVGAPVTAAEILGPPAQPATEAPAPAVEGTDRAQEMWNLWRALGLSGPDNRAARVQLAVDAVGRALGSLNDLTADEADRLITELRKHVADIERERAEPAYGSAPVDEVVSGEVEPDGGWPAVAPVPVGGGV